MKTGINGGDDGDGGGGGQGCTTITALLSFFFFCFLFVLLPFQEYVASKLSLHYLQISPKRVSYLKRVMHSYPLGHEGWLTKQTLPSC